MRRGEPIGEGGKTPRFSLVLSSVLMFGVVKVYHQQQVFMYGEHQMSILTLSLHIYFMQPTKNIADVLEDLKNLLRSVKTASVDIDYRHPK